MNSTQMAYRKAAVEGASGFNLLLTLYDALISDLRRAADAQRSGDLQRRGREVNHALLVLGFMENWMDPNSGGELAHQLRALYSKIRFSLIPAQARQSVEMLEQYIPDLLSLRMIWHDIQLRPGLQNSSPSVGQLSSASDGYEAERTACNWCA